MDPESSDSDVSVGGGDEYRYASPLTAPIPLPAPPSKHALESADAVQARLDELSRVETNNEKKYSLLKAKRQRKDDKIRRKREAQDKKWLAITEARKRRDARIAARRKREDAAFTQFFEHDLDEEETNLRRRLKRLKRGLPLDESPKASTRSVSGPSMSPPASLSTIPPPAKRHQVGPPGQPDSVNSAQSRPSPQSNMPGSSTKSSLPGPPYSFYRDPNSAFSRPYQHGSYSSSPNGQSPTTGTNRLPDPAPAPPSHDRPLGILGRATSPRPRPSGNAQSPLTPGSSTNTQPPRQTSSSYDTRPPPTNTGSGFASINAPPSGFASINARPTSTPPAAHTPMTRPQTEGDVNRTPIGSHPNGGLDKDRFQQYGHTPTGVPSPGTSNSGSKRTPSTTHPYQMSEAFANRHHHCERVDSLNRGIWTSYGPGGTAENPTSAAVEMYLRCNHDNCSRIDWRTVHGLQCHIVKNHSQPKGTIGSLDKALERYGIPVKEVEDYEREHGNGSAGTMADPKNHKIKVKTKEATGLETRPYVRKDTPGVYDPDARPAGYRPSPAESPALSDDIKQSPTVSMNGFSREATTEESRRPPSQTTTASPMNTYSSSSNWYRNPFPGGLPPLHADLEPKRLQGDFGASEAAVKSSQPPPLGHHHQQAGSNLANGIQNKSPPLNTLPPPPKSSNTISVADTSKAASNIDASPVPSASSLAPTIPTTTEAPQAAEVPADANKDLPAHKEIAPSDALPAKPNGPAPGAATADPDVQMTDVDQQLQKENGNEKPTEISNGTVVGDDKQATPAAEVSSVPKVAPSGPDGEPVPKSEPGVSSQAPEEADLEDQSETIVVDGETGKEAGAAKRNAPSTNGPFQSPVMTTRSVQAAGSNVTTPTRRGSRRSSVVRKSVDRDGDNNLNSNEGRADKENEDKDEKDVREEKVERETRRSITGRLLRRGR
ncbi:hypothetical protein PV08_06650 [Exophiala spinifera]|uniref:Uncharacterized protein n=1 Tax=Exophiala spinifera TaxID=91928 RepID=A0A0D2BRI7_9EURO|nr:uncharacterized protein PV08_06650 [Exophiala spinifera]KIW13869.1 hypothetical protein PV08_06650 [Exophiala spinifera]